MSPKVSKKYLEARRAEILGAAFKCFMGKGFHNTTMQDIYQAANLSPGAVYNYFPSKEDIVVEALKVQQTYAGNSIASLISGNPEEALINLARRSLSYIQQNDVSMITSIELEFYAEAMRNKRIREAILSTQDALHIKIIELVKQKQRAGVFNDKLDPLSITRALVGMLVVILIHKSMYPDVDVDAYGQVCEAILNGTFSSPPKRRRRTD